MIGGNGHTTKPTRGLLVVTVFRQGEVEIGPKYAQTVAIHKGRVSILWANEITPLTYELSKGDLVNVIKVED